MEHTKMRSIIKASISYKNAISIQFVLVCYGRYISSLHLLNAG